MARGSYDPLQDGTRGAHSYIRIENALSTFLQSYTERYHHIHSTPCRRAVAYVQLFLHRQGDMQEDSTKRLHRTQTVVPRPHHWLDPTPGTAHHQAPGPPFRFYDRIPGAYYRQRQDPQGDNEFEAGRGGTHQRGIGPNWIAWLFHVSSPK
ncbi:hypothetical protein LZ30DRAFT_388113 [Colletotrichum cereale]|nr:hypothetical protein LZ30DRAFT_388113 [Colletotrichum cereale]